MNPVHDNYNRIIDYMRISVTDRCNLRCIYCMPSDGIRHAHSKNVLKYEEIIRVVKIAARLGVRKIRLTGGEPLFRRDLHYLVKSMNTIPGIEDIGITTNGLLLKKYAEVFAAAGLKRVNVSLDSLQPDRYREITRGGDIRQVFAFLLLGSVFHNGITAKGIYGIGCGYSSAHPTQLFHHQA